MNKVPTPLKLTAIDLENTGLNPFADRIVEIGLVHFDLSGEQSRWNVLINPERDIPPNVQDIHGISEDDVKDCPPIENVFSPFLDQVRGRVLVVHNVLADLPFLEMESYRLGTKLDSFWTIDTLKLSRKVYPEAPNHQLSSLCQFLNLEISPHRALEDAWGAMQIFLHAIRDMKLSPDEIVPELKRNKILTKSGYITKVQGRTIHDLWIKQGARYHLLYSNSKGEDTDRWIRVIQIYLKGRQVCIEAFCETKQEIRMFFVKNIKEITSE
ncbi:3'-5' exonuclease [Spirochaeta cellobiosiphila]|uniref:3'-5' exonuclease n=1 Tax=Spirochaeta cellobiosiphila TaxID=504483 RepID=UPI00146CC347|nr:exonuclease domain-containing protein [Spirochaeta cellobiosiphila]